MKPNLFFITLIGLLTLASCDQQVTFKEPQPADTRDLRKIPSKIQGKYVGLEDSSLLLIDKRSIVKIYDLHYNRHIKDFDSTWQIIGNAITDLNTNEKMTFSRNDDSLYIHFLKTDTLFTFDHFHVLRAYKGYYFMNTLTNPNREDGKAQPGEQTSLWNVKRLELTKGRLTINSITTEEEIKSLQEITESTADTVPPNTFSPTKKEFTAFIRGLGFSDGETYVRR